MAIAWATVSRASSAMGSLLAKSPRAELRAAKILVAAGLEVSAEVSRAFRPESSERPDLEFWATRFPALPEVAGGGAIVAPRALQAAAEPESASVSSVCRSAAVSAAAAPATSRSRGRATAVGRASRPGKAPLAEARAWDRADDPGAAAASDADPCRAKYTARTGCARA